jgi:hypothetical protein
VIPEPLVDAWWQQENPCPAGGNLQVIEEKRSFTRLCLLRGKRHGPFRAQAGDLLLQEGWYVFGAKHGHWRRFDGITKQNVAETYHCDRVVERVAEEPAPFTPRTPR